MKSLAIRRAALALLSLSVLPGCVDSLGVSGGDCSSQMTRVRRDEGRPPDQVQENDISGDFSEVWTYWISGTEARRYSFTWGVSVLSCQAEGPVTVPRTLIPEVGPILP